MKILIQFLAVILSLNATLASAQIDKHYCEKSNKNFFAHMQINSAGGFILESYFKTDLGSLGVDGLVEIGQYASRNDTIIFAVQKVVDGQDTIMVSSKSDLVGYPNQSGLCLVRGSVKLQFRTCSINQVQRLRKKFFGKVP